MRIFRDKELLEEVKVLDLGIVPAGETERFTFWVSNDSNASLRNLEFVVEHAEVEVSEAPKELSPQAVDELKLVWTPSITLKEGLRAQLKVTGIELWG